MSDQLLSSPDTWRELNVVGGPWGSMVVGDAWDDPVRSEVFKHFDPLKKNTTKRNIEFKCPI